MGYTHYWDHAIITPEAWAGLVSDSRRIIKAADIPLAGPDGTGVPVIDRDRISFNGTASDDQDYETFELTPAITDFDFCKTARRPYDLVVTAILLRAVLTVPGFRIQSDGDWLEDWQDARVIYARVFGEEPPINYPFKR